MKLFKGLNKSSVGIKEVVGLPKKVKDDAYNIKANKITIRYFLDLNFKESQDITGEIIHYLGYPIIIFERPFSGAILYLEDCTYHNQSKDNELTIDLVKDYPFGIDHRSDLAKIEGVEYANSGYELTIMDKSQIEYYKNTYKFYIPMMLNRKPIPIIKLDFADRILKPIDKIEVKRLSNISQSFLRTFIRLKLLEKTGTKKDNINGFMILFFLMMGALLWEIIRAFL